jgi:hypothetical protein
VSPTGSLSDYAFGTNDAPTAAAAAAAAYNGGTATPPTAIGSAAYRQQLTSFDQFLSMVLDSETARSNSPLNRALRRGSVLVAKVADATKQAARETHRCSSNRSITATYHTKITVRWCQTACSVKLYHWPLKVSVGCSDCTCLQLVAWFETFLIDTNLSGEVYYAVTDHLLAIGG